jgi:hypothetical protein
MWDGFLSRRGQAQRGGAEQPLAAHDPSAPAPPCLALLTQIFRANSRRVRHSTSRMKRFLGFLAVALSITAAAVVTAAPPVPPNRFGVASGAEWSGDYPKFEPMLRDAGVGWLRYFREWHGLQPKPGEWDWKWADEFLSVSRGNQLQVTGVFAYFAPWASSGGDTRTFPVRDMQSWRDFTGGVVAHCAREVSHWEIWNEPQAFQKNGTPQYYAAMVREAYDAGKKSDPKAQFGITVANFGVAYLDQALKAGAADHFDYLCVHPYENVDQLLRPGGEVYFLSLAGSLRRLLAAHHQRADLPLWITEIGYQAPIQPDAKKDALQAELLAKVYVLSFAQGFERVFWFEARGPAYGKGTDHGLIRPDWSPRPVYTSLKTMIGALSGAPEYLGWLDFHGAYGFVFGSPRGPVLAAWAPVGREEKLKFASAVSVLDVAGKETKVPAGQEFVLTNAPVFVSGLPAPLVQEAKSHAAKPFPWGGNFTKAETVSYRAGEPNGAGGIEAIGNTAPGKDGEQNYVRIQKGGSVSFRVNPTFASYGDTDLEIKVVARRAAPDKDAGFQTMFETLKTTHGYDRAGWWTVPAGDQWHEHTWRLSDANFVGTWAYNFAMTEVTGEYWVKEVSVRRVGKK